MPLKLNGKKATQRCEDGFLGLQSADVECTKSERKKYYSKLSRPLLDRVDIQVEVQAVKFKDIVTKAEGESSEEIRERVSRAREIQTERFRDRRIYVNARMGTRDVKKH